MRKAIGEFAGQMHDDLIDGVQWAVDQGYADPEHVAIMGWSYGGYATLVGLTFTPDRFTCGIAIAGMSDLTTLVEADRKTMSKKGIKRWHKYIGNPKIDSERKLMKAKSPLSHVDNITRPLLIMHGGEDSIVSSDESDQMVDAMEKVGKEVDYVFFPDEGHSFEKWKSWSVLFRKVEVFLATHLGGRSESIVTEFPNTSGPPMINPNS
jgi:dipeptidyl aminopeptidase/acylaminoacyl peptidase